MSYEPVCYGCEHCGCDPFDPDDYCIVCPPCDNYGDCTCGLPSEHAGDCS